ncbi:hypothetical protein ABZZ79_34745 [Streptomyces sp. NPDC006458]|uniref:hypothetical protein n=1 Tax=Streptomyces sp. NPDC006458 TaxID=3154302 RepID=UPI0033B02E94
MSAPTTPRAMTAQETGRRVEEILDRLAAGGDLATATAAEELVRSLMDFYGSGLARILQLLSATLTAPGEPAARLLGDELVASLLVLHDLHPEDRDTRIRRALDSVPGQDLEVLGFDQDTGLLRLRAAAASGGCGCGSGADGAREAVEAALACFAPEVGAVDIETAPAGPTFLQIGAAPTGAR